MIASAEAAADASQALTTELAAEMHREPPGEGHGATSRCSYEIVHGEPVMTGCCRQNPPWGRLWPGWRGFICERDVRGVPNGHHQSAAKTRHDRCGQFAGPAVWLWQTADDASARFADPIEQVREGREVPLRGQLCDPINQHEVGGYPTAMHLVEGIAVSLVEIPHQSFTIEVEHSSRMLFALPVRLQPVALNVTKHGRGGFRRTEQDERAVMARVVGQQASDSKPQQIEFGADHSSSMRSGGSTRMHYSPAWGVLTTGDRTDLREQTRAHGRDRCLSSSIQG